MERHLSVSQSLDFAGHYDVDPDTWQDKILIEDGETSGTYELVLHTLDGTSETVFSEAFATARNWVGKWKNWQLGTRETTSVAATGTIPFNVTSVFTRFGHHQGRAVLLDNIATEILRGRHHWENGEYKGWLWDQVYYGEETSEAHPIAGTKSAHRKLYVQHHRPLIEGGDREVEADYDYGWAHFSEVDLTPIVDAFIAQLGASEMAGCYIGLHFRS